MTLDLRTLHEYPWYTEVTLRFSDQDSQRHINNVSYAAYIEAGRIDFLHRALNQQDMTATSVILAHVEVDYLREMHYPGTLRVGTGIERIGNSSIATCHGIFMDDILYAVGRSVVVSLGEGSKPSTLKPEVVESLEPYIISER